MRFPRLFDLYLSRRVIGTVLATWGVLLGLDAVISFAGEMGELGKGGYTVGHALAYIGYTLPRRAYQLFPTAAVIGALMGLGQLAATSELTALRALGVSRPRLTASVALGLALLTGVMVANGETLGPWGEARSQAVRSVRNPDMVVEQYSGLWAREGTMVLNARNGEQKSDGQDTWLELRDVRLFEFEEDGRLRSIARAALAEHRGGSWRLREVERTRFAERSVTRDKVAEEAWDSNLDEAALAANVTKPRYIPTDELRAGIDYRKRNGLEAAEYEEIYWGRWFYPLNVLALCLAAIPFAFGSLRSGGYGKRLFLGIVFALGFWIAQTITIKVAQVFSLDFRLMYTIPLLLALLASWMGFKRRSN